MGYHGLAPNISQYDLFVPLYTYHYSLFSDLTFFWLPTMVQTIQNPLERQPWFKKTLECHILFMYIDVCVYVMDLIVYNIILSIYIYDIYVYHPSSSHVTPQGMAID